MDEAQTNRRGSWLRAGGGYHGQEKKSILPIQQKAEVNSLDHRAIQDGSISSQEAREKSSASDLFCLRFERPTKLVITEHVQNSVQESVHRI